MKTYANTSFLVRIYPTQSDSPKTLAFMRDFRDPLPFTPLHRHELRNAIRLAVFRKEIDAARGKTAFEDIESDLADGILAHVPISWTNAFREAEQLGAAHTEDMGVHGIDLLHTGRRSLVQCERVPHLRFSASRSRQSRWPQGEALTGAAKSVSNGIPCACAAVGRKSAPPDWAATDDSQAVEQG